ncbi:MAG: MOSC domain-containing protein [Deltaproteobacteria bacterium]|nr:MOSC domain-containing protein [Deltaproteobacteria bacterium]
MSGIVIAVSRCATHSMSKSTQDQIRLIEGLGVEGDAHLGQRVQHLSRVKRDPTQPNLRQVHIIHSELFNELEKAGFEVSPGLMGENITTANVDLLALSTGTYLHLGESAVVEVTGLRNPCNQLDGLQEGLMAATLDRDEEGELIRRAGIMGIVVVGGDVEPGDPIRVEPPPEPHRALIPI